MAPTPIDGNRYATARDALKDKIRQVQDFPEEGVLFEDLTPVLADCLLYTSPSPRDLSTSRMPSSA